MDISQRARKVLGATIEFVVSLDDTPETDDGWMALLERWRVAVCDEVPCADVDWRNAEVALTEIMKSHHRVEPPQNVIDLFMKRNLKND